MDKQRRGRLEELIKRRNEQLDVAGLCTGIGRDQLITMIHELDELAGLLLEASRDVLRREGLEVDG